MLQLISREFLVEPTWQDESGTEFPATTFQKAAKYQDIASQLKEFDPDRARDLVEDVMDRNPVPLRDPENGLVISNAGVQVSHLHISPVTKLPELELYGLVLLSEKNNPLFHSMLRYKGSPRSLVRFPFATVLEADREPSNHLHHLDIIVPTLLDDEEEPLINLTSEESEWPTYERMNMALHRMDGEACSELFEQLLVETVLDKKHGIPRFDS